MPFHVGSYVVHTKLAELGSGEIIKAEMGGISIRFASGVRNFSEAIVTAYLEKTLVAPVLPAPRAAKPKGAAKKKSATPTAT